MAVRRELTEKEQVLRELQRMPNVGPSIALDLWDLGVRRPADLARRDPQRMYDDLREQRGGTMDRCMLYVLRAAVYYAATPEPDAARVQWWKWSDKALEDEAE
jgi:hypothetical protein